MNYKEKYEHGLECIQEILSGAGDSIKTSILRKRLQAFFPELKESKDDRIVRCLLNYFNHVRYNGLDLKGTDIDEVIAWLEKQGEKTNPYSGMSFEYNGHIWGMCARDNGVDILLDKQLFKHLDTQGEKRPTEDAKKLNADKVIEWLKNTIREKKIKFGEYGLYLNTNLELPYNSIEDIINDFKEDFGLC